MLKRIAFVLVVCTCVSVAFGAVRITDFMMFDESDTADAMAILNYASGQDKTIVQIMVSDFTPNEGYSLKIGGITSLSPVIFTDGHGHGTLHQEFFGDRSTDAVELFVDLSRNGRMDAGELRAIGFNGG